MPSSNNQNGSSTNGGSQQPGNTSSKKADPNTQTTFSAKNGGGSGTGYSTRQSTVQEQRVWGAKWALLGPNKKYTDPKWIEYVDWAQKYLMENPELRSKDSGQFETLLTDVSSTYKAFGQTFDAKAFRSQFASGGGGGLYPYPTLESESSRTGKGVGRREAPVYKGGQTGLNGEPLPVGATAYNSKGEPNYNPISDTSKLTPEQKKAMAKAAFNLIGPNFGSIIDSNQLFDQVWNATPPGLRQFGIDVWNDWVGLGNKVKSEFAPAPPSPEDSANKPTIAENYLSAQQAFLSNNPDWKQGKVNINDLIALESATFKSGTDWLDATLKEIAPPWAESIADTVGNVLQAGGDVLMYAFNKPAEYTERLIGYGSEKIKQSKDPLIMSPLGKKLYVEAGKVLGLGVTENEFTPMTDLEMYEISKMAWTTDPIMTVIQETVAKTLNLAATSNIVNFVAGKFGLKSLKVGLFGNEIEIIKGMDKDTPLLFGYTQLASHVEMSLAQNQMRRDDFLNRIRNGDNPTDVALQLSNPARELLGQIFIDPTNLIGDILGPIMRNGKMSKVLGETNVYEAIKAEQGVEAAAAARKAQNAIRTGAETIGDMKLADSIAAASRASVEAALYAKQTGSLIIGGKKIEGFFARVFAPMAKMNINKTLNSMQLTLSAIAAEANSLSKFKGAVKESAEFMVKQLGAMAIVAKGPGVDDTARVAYEAALRIVYRSNASAFMLSSTGMETGKVLGQVFFDSAGKWDNVGVEKLVKMFAESGTDVSIATERLMPEVEKFFPSLGKRMGFEDEAAALMKGGMAFEDMPKHLQQWASTPVGDFTRAMEKVLGGGEKVMNLWMPMMSRIYIRYNPAVMSRNLIQNELQIMIDYGLRANFTDPVKGMEWLQGFMLESRGSMKGLSSGLSGLIGDLEDITGTKKSGDWMELFKKASPYDKTEMWGKAQVAITSARNSIDSLSYMHIADDMVLHSMGLPDDMVKYMNHASIQGFSHRKVVDALRNGDVVRSLDALLGKGESEYLRKFGLYDELNDYLVKGISSDDAKLKIYNDAKDFWEAGHKTPRMADPLGDISPLSAKLRADSERAMADGSVIDDLFERTNAQYDVAIAEANAAYDGSINAGRQSLYANGADKKLLFDYDQAASRGRNTIDKMRNDVYSEIDVQRKLWREDGKIAYEVYRSRAATIIKKSHLDQLGQYNKNLAELNKISGLDIRQMNLNYWMSAEDEFGLLLTMDNMDPAWYAMSGMNFSGAGGNRTLSILDSYGLHFPTRNGQKYSFKRIEGVLNQAGIKVSWQDIATGKVDDATLKQIEEWAKIVGDPLGIGSRTERMVRGDEIKKALGSGKFEPERIELDAIEKMEKDAEAGIIPEKFFKGGKPATNIQDVQRIADESDELYDLRRTRDLYKKDALEMQDKAHDLGKDPQSVFGDRWIENQKNLKGANLKYSAAAKKEGSDVVAYMGVEYSLEGSAAKARMQEYSILRKKEINSSIFQRIGETTNTAVGDAVNAGNHVAAGEQELHIKAMLDKVFGKMDDDIGKVKSKLELDDSGWQKLYKWAEDGDLKLAEARPTIMAKMDADIEHTLLDYSNKRGFDRLASFIFPYHFWYSRTYANWLKRIPQNYAVVSSYAKWKRQMEVLHAGLPSWWKYQINTNEIFGLDSKNPIYFNLEATLNPLNGITGQDFTSETRRTGWLTSMIDDIGKYGPSVHTPYLLAIATYYALRGEKDVAESWAGRLIPQTGPIKSLSAMFGLDPMGTGGIELDPNVWLFSDGIEKYERQRATKMLGEMEQAGEITHAEAIEAGYRQKGDIWKAAVIRANQGRALGNIMGGILGVGFKGRSQGEILIDQFSTEMNALYQRLPNLSPEERQKAWNSLFQKYPYASSILMSRKNGLARDEAFSYDVLRRIPPGQIDDICKVIGVDYDIVGSFYENGLIGMAETDRMRFMAAILDIGSLAELPPTALRVEWDVARERYSEIMKDIPEETLALVDDYYKIKDTSLTLSEQFLKKHPEVSQYMDWKAKAIMADPILQTYYGGINFIEGYYRRIALGAAEAQWPGIGELVAADNELRAGGGDYKAYEDKYPEIAEYRKWMKGQNVQIDAALERLAGKLPEKPELIWRKDAKAESIMSYEFLRQMGGSDSVKTVSSLAQPYMYEPETTDSGLKFEVNAFITAQAELRWPGMTKLLAEYNKYKSEDTKLASAFAYQHPEIKEYMAFAAEIRKNYNATQKQTQEPVASDWDTWAGVFDENVQRLLVDYFGGAEMSSTLRNNLYRTWQQAGSPMGSFDAWINTLRSSYSG
jgi:hypothetical protein